MLQFDIESLLDAYARGLSPLGAFDSAVPLWGVHSAVKTILTSPESRRPPLARPFLMSRR